MALNCSLLLTGALPAGVVERIGFDDTLLLSGPVSRGFEVTKKLIKQNTQQSTAVCFFMKQNSTNAAIVACISKLKINNFS